MIINFDMDNVIHTEFGVGFENGSNQSFVIVPVDAMVQVALRQMVSSTWDLMKRSATDPSKYEPSEKHSDTEYLYLPIDDSLASSVKLIHDAVNLPLQAGALNEPATLYCYFTRLTDSANHRLTALRRSSQFKGVVKSRGRLIRLIDDSLKIIEDQVFKLDLNYDMLIDSATVHILHPSGFEFIGNLNEAILTAVPENIKSIKRDVTFVDFSGIEEYASKHPRAARYLASIREQKETKNINKSALKKLCKSTSVDVSESNGKITVKPGHELGFLEVLDRRRYELELVTGHPERFKAASRRKIDG